jgi:UPF0755 protein
MSARAMRRALIVFAATGVVLLAGAYLGYRFVVGFPERPAASPGRPVTLTIPRGASFPRIVELVQEKGLVSNGLAFRIYANYRRLESKLRHGTYELHTSMTPKQLLDRLSRGVAAPTAKVTLPEGKNMLEVARLISTAEISDYESLVGAMRDSRFLHRLGVPGETMEGYLFPDTYRFQLHSKAEKVLEVLFRRHMQVFVKIRGKYPTRTHWLRRRLGWDHHEIVTLASIVEKETGQPRERPLIAGVFLNRLVFPKFEPRLLQTDPTIIYGCTVPLEKSKACQKFEGRIRRIHLNDPDNIYNTYTHEGLPPGPISNPGAAAIEAVFSPKRSRYLFFVSRNDGTHKFSATEREHEAAVDRYQRN